MIWVVSIYSCIAFMYSLAIINSAALTVGVHVSFQITVLSGICMEVGLLDHMATLCLVFWGTSILFSIVAAPSLSSVFVICRLCNDGHSD